MPQQVLVPVDSNVIPQGYAAVRVGRTNANDPSEKYLGNDGAVHSSSANRDGRIRLIIAEVREPKYAVGSYPFLVKYVPERAPYAKVLEVLGTVDGEFQYRVSIDYHTPTGIKAKKFRVLESDLSTCADPDACDDDCDC